MRQSNLSSKTQRHYVQWKRIVEEDVADSVLCVASSGISDVDVVGGRHRQPAGNEAEDSRLGRRAGLRPGRAIT